MLIELPVSLWLYPILALIVYLPSFRGPFIFDDHDLMNNLKDVKTWKEIVGASRPVTVLSYFLNREWPGTARGMRVTNALLHAGTALVVERIAAGLLHDPLLGLVAGAVFAVHPFGANTVSYVTGRASILSALFGLSAVWALLAGYGVLALPLLALAVLSKEDGVGFVPLVMLAAVFTGNWLLLAVLLLGAAFGLGRYRRRIRALWKGNGDTAMATVGLPLSYKQPIHFWTVLVATLTKIPQWMIGLGQSPYHGSGVPVPGFRGGFFALLTLGSCAAFAVSFPGFAFAVALLLLGPWLVYLVCPVPDQLAEYRNYSMLSGMAILATMSFGQFPTPFGFAIAVGLFGATLALACAGAAMNWSDPIAMWSASARNASGDRSRAYQEMGAWWKFKGELQSAENVLRQALQLNPNLAPALNNLAWICLQTERTDEGIRLMEECGRRVPTYEPTWHELPIIYEQAGRFEKAERAFERLKKFQIQRENHANHLGLIAYRAKNLPRAAKWFDRAIEEKPGHFEYIYNRAMTFKAAGDMAAAMQCLSVLTPPLPLTDNMIRPTEMAPC